LQYFIVDYANYPCLIENNGGQVTELKSQVSDLNDKVNRLNHMLEELSDKVFHMKLQDNLTATKPAEPKRKVRAKTSHPNPPAIAPPAPLPMEVEELQPAPVLPLADDISPRDTFFTADGLEAWDDGLLDFDAPITPIPPSTASANSASSTDRPAVAPVAPIAQPLPAEVSSSATTTVTSLTTQDIAAVLESLSPELKVRFVDKLAEAVGANLAANLQNAQHSQPIETCQPLMLPSGSQAPEIAWPLASAALGAFVMSSLQSLGGNVPNTAKNGVTISA
jgi:hypothetical protein